MYLLLFRKKALGHSSKKWKLVFYLSTVGKVGGGNLFRLHVLNSVQTFSPAIEARRHPFLKWVW
jgi:hypothetical protein